MRFLTAENVRTWVSGLTDEDSPHVLAISHESALVRRQLAGHAYKATGFLVAGYAPSPDDWVSGLSGALSNRISRLGGTQRWGWLSQLVQRPFFIAEEPLRTMIDGNTSPLTGVFTTLWEARLRSQEGRDIQSLLESLALWVSGSYRTTDLTVLKKTRIERPLASVEERTDMLLFLLALARQNGFVDRTVLVFDALEQADESVLHDLTTLCQQVERWSALGSGVGILLGLSGEASDWKHIPYLHRLLSRPLV